MRLLAAALDADPTPAPTERRGLKRQIEWEDLCRRSVHRPTPLDKAGVAESQLAIGVGAEVSLPVNQQQQPPLHQAVTKLMHLMIRTARQGVITPQVIRQFYRSLR